jgi:O-antigen/teichoic acid export membrane protein
VADPRSLQEIPTRAGGSGPSGPEAGSRPLRSTAVYALAAASQRLGIFVLLPFVTRVMSPDSYGDLSILLALSSGFAALFNFGLEPPMFRAFIEFESDHRGKRHYVGSVWRFLIAAPVLLALTVGGIVWAIGGVGRIDGFDIFLAILGAALFVAATGVPLALLRAEQRLRDYLLLALANTLVTPTLIFALVIVSNEEATGWLLAVVISNLSTLGLALFVVPWTSEGKARGTFRSVVTEGMPLMPHFLAQWSLNLADRLVLAGIVSASLLGVYSLAANLAIPILVFVQAVNQGFMPSYARAGVDPSRRHDLRSTVCLQIGIVTATAVAGIVLAAPTVALVSPSSYHGAAPLLAWLILGFFFLGLYYIPMNGATLGAKRGKFAWVATVISAAVNIGLIIVLVPIAGIEYAAVASAAGYLVLLAGIALYARGPGNPVEYDWPRIIALEAVAGMIVAGILILAPQSGPDGLAIRLAGAVVGAVVILVIAVAGSGKSQNLPRMKLTG